MVWRKLFLMVLLCVPLPTQAVAQTTAAPKTDLSVFDEVWNTVNRNFYDPEFRGIDWQAMRDKYRPLAAAAPDEAAQAEIIDRMLAELGASHTARYLPDDPAYYQLVDIF